MSWWSLILLELFVLGTALTADALATAICTQGAACAHRGRNVARGMVLYEATRRHVWLSRRWTS